VCHVVEEHFQVLVIVKVCSDEGSDGGGAGERCSGYILDRRENITGLSRVKKLPICDLFHCHVLSPHTETMVGPLHEEPVGAVPVSVDYVHPSVAVKVSKGHSSAVLEFILHT